MMKRLLLGLVLVIMMTSTAAAQRRANTHSGFWLSAGGGGGWFDGSRGGAAYVRLGGTPTRKVQFGGEALVWFRDDTSQTNTTATALFYPFYRTAGAPGHELFFKGGFGVANNDAGNSGRGTASVWRTTCTSLRTSA